MKKFYQIELKNVQDVRGNLVIAEFEKEIPFLVKRIFYAYNTEKDANRGGHANKNSKFFMISIAGSCKVIADDGRIREEFLLDRPTKALYMDNMVWKNMTEFTQDNVLLILTDCIYDHNEYIKDYDVFLDGIN